MRSARFIGSGEGPKLAEWRATGAQQTIFDRDASAVRSEAIDLLNKRPRPERAEPRATSARQTILDLEMLQRFGAKRQEKKIID